MNRRKVLEAMLALGAVGPLSAKAQTGAKSPVLGVLSSLPIVAPEQWARSPFWRPLRKLGWIEGQTLNVERASGEGDVQRLMSLAQELVRKQVDAIFAPGNESALAAARATTTIPIIFWGVNYPVDMGLVESLARPGGNVTGIALFVGPSESAKTLEYLREMVPRARRLSYIYEAAQVRKVDGTEWSLARGYIETAAKARGFELHEHPISRSEDLEVAFNHIGSVGAQALYVGYSQLTLSERKRIVAFANRSRLPSVFNAEPHVADGGILSYGPNIPDLFERSASYVDKVLRGTRPNNLPVELPTKYDLWINIKAAKAIDIEIPESIRLRADGVIE